MHIAPLTPTFDNPLRPGGLPGWQIRQVTAYIDANLDATLRTASLAATVGLSVSHFTRAFKHSVGVPPRVFVIRRRLAAACAAMLASDAPLTAIAHAHGFCDQSHFTRTFHETIGVAPHAWRCGNSEHCRRKMDQNTIPLENSVISTKLVS
ncbi:AraC family transcriptional regulator [Massilia sp.]|uniref:AraC family transcriptional regulator n=1 Tax=Massilia sp. TaxID=1882437 RepID=UPI00289BBCE2|nr:AraC family transcriptional regulator [Massilia sp.]